jgi:hypothetical protein
MTNYFDTLGNNNQSGVLEEDEIKQILMNFAASRGERGFNEGEAYQVVKWADDAKISAIMLNMVLDNSVFVDFNGKEVVFKNAKDTTA